MIKEVWTDIKELAIQKNIPVFLNWKKLWEQENIWLISNEIWNATLEGRGKTIFVEEGYYQPVREDNGIFTLSLMKKYHQNDIFDI